jgi:hypothetical protein
MSSHQRKRPRTTPKHREDRDEEKCFPNGISATVRAIQQYWPHIIDPTVSENLGVDEFLSKSDFIAVYESVIDIYQGIEQKAKEYSSINGMIGDIGRPEKGKKLSFYELRALAAFVDLPTGLFLLFTQLISDERREKDEGGDPRGRAQKLINGIRAFVNAAQKHIDSIEEGDQLFTYIYDHWCPVNYRIASTG